MTCRRVVLASLILLAVWPAAASAQDCANPPMTLELGLVPAAQNRAVTLRVPARLVAGCDLPADPLTATIDWGDGTTTSATIEDAMVLGVHTYANAGTFALVITLRNGRTGVAREDRHYEATVDPAGLVIRRAPLTWRIGRPFAGVLATYPIAGARLITDYTAKIAWGDGTTTQATVSARGGRLSVAGRHTWRRAPHSFTVTVTAAGSGATLAIRRPLKLHR